MPRASRTEAAQHREDIVLESSRLFRDRGLAGVSVADATAAVGMTHGGFYKHFASKDALAGEATAAAFNQAMAFGESLIAGETDKVGQWRAVIDHYLSAGHRDERRDGCPATAFSADVTRESARSPMHQAYVAGIEDAIAFFQRVGPDDPDREEMLVRYSTMVGALTLARATKGDPISDEILAAVSKHFDETI